MMARRSCWSSRVLAAVALAAALGLSVPAAASAQDGLADLCAGESFAAAEGCYLAASGVRLVHPRVGTALWGGSPVPGSASTLGMRLGSLPRFSVSGRLTVLPMEIPPVGQSSAAAGERALATSFSGQATVGLLSGWSPLPTVGGVLSVDAIGRASWLLLPGDQGFTEGSVLGASLGLRLGALRESFTMPGVSVTAAYGRSTSFGLGDDDIPSNGYVESGVGNWNLTGAVTKRVGPVGVTAGAAWDRYTGDVRIDYPGAAPGTGEVESATDRWSAFGNVSWTFLILHASLEAGWQESSVPDGVSSTVDLDPTGWWLGGAFRISI